MTADIMLTPLTDAEVDLLAKHEAVIERGLQTVIEFGNSLCVLRDAKLYRQTHGTFEAYCQDRFGFTATRARQMIAAAETATIVSVAGGPIPATESQARELVGLPPETAAEVMRTAAETGKITALTIRHAREVVAPPDPVTDKALLDGLMNGDGQMRRLNFQADLARNIVRAHRAVLAYDVSDVGAMADPEQFDALDSLAGDFVRFAKDARRARRVLKVAPGGSR